jgi:signal transduction histidine kinase
LGVALVKEIVSIHGGDVEFITAEGRGMAVTVWLPMAQD